MSNQLNFSLKASKSKDLSIPCDDCGKDVTRDNRVFLTMRISCLRAARERTWAFCSEKCRDNWWASPDGKALSPVYKPGHYPKHTECASKGCEKCNWTGEDRNSGLHDNDVNIPPNAKGIIFGQVDQDLKVEVLLRNHGNRNGVSAFFVCKTPNALNVWWNDPVADGELLPSTSTKTK